MFDLNTVIIDRISLNEKLVVLELLDEFRSVCYQLIDDKVVESHTARDFGSKLFDEYFDSDDLGIFLAKKQNEYLGIGVVFRIPQIRKGNYVGEIEVFYVKQDFWGTGIAKKMMDHVEIWCKDVDIVKLRLETELSLHRAHSFYEKVGFSHYAKAYQKVL